MTPEQRQLCRDLLIDPAGRREISKEKFLLHFPSAVRDGRLARELVDQADMAQNAEDLQCALIVGFAFQFSPEIRDVLVRLLNANWHHSHEDIVTALEIWQSPDTVDALYRITQWIPKYLEFDENRALAIKAIWALGKVPGADAQKRLEELARSDEPLLQKCAVKQLKRGLR